MWQLSFVRWELLLADMKAEGESVGKWLQENGISAFVLRYRTAGFWAFLTRFRYLFRGNRYPDAFNDLQMAMQYIRNHAVKYGISPSKVGVMGFSAGGHLVMSAAELLPPSERPRLHSTYLSRCNHGRQMRS